MTSERWRKLATLFAAARECPAEKYTAFLDQACSDDTEMRAELESLLQPHVDADDFLEQPAIRLLGVRQTREAPSSERRQPGSLDRVSSRPLAPGAQLGRYRIESFVGAGGMGEVYKAADTRLGRPVAIKLSARELSDRFEREARTISALNHPHICTLYDVGPNYLVMEYVEGHTLAARLRKSALRMQQVLRYGSEIADALAAAHAQGIIHRDLKPSNIMVAKSGIKVLDFGLAKSARDDTLTGSHIVIGSTAYMAPEQREGKECDARTDIFTLGLVLYEMATGRRPAQDQPEAMDKFPVQLAHVIGRCLQKDPADRWQTARDLQAEIAWAANLPSQSSIESSQKGLRYLPWVVAGAIAAASLLFTLRLGRAPTEAPEMRLQVATPPTTDPVSMAISPDGRQIVFSAIFERHPVLWLRPLDSTSAQPLAGTNSGTFPFWAPDSRSVGFFAERQLKRIDLASGTVQALARVEAGRGGAWNSDGTIIFQPTPLPTPLLRISASGGEPVELRVSGRFPQFLPDGRHFLYYALGPPAVRGIYVGDLDNSEPRRLLDAEGAAVCAGSGHLLFVREGTVFAQGLNLSRLKLQGDAVPLAEHATANGSFYSAPLSASTAGLVVYRAGAAGTLRQLVWFDGSGQEVARIGEPAANLLSPSISPDGRRVAFHRPSNGTTDIWQMDIGKGILTRLWSDPSGHWSHSPLWSPDGSKMVFTFAPKIWGDLYIKGLDGGQDEQLLLESAQEKASTDWSRDGRFLLYMSLDPKSAHDIWALPMDKKAAPFPVVRTDFEERNGQFSPDGKWVAYQSNDSGRFEIYVQPFPSPGNRIQISNNGGAQVRWRSDGKELFYIALDGRLMSVSISAAPGGATLESGIPVALFTTRGGDPLQVNSRQTYMVSADGRRFLMNTISEESTPITVILNWKGRH